MNSVKSHDFDDFSVRTRHLLIRLSVLRTRRGEEEGESERIETNSPKSPRAYLSRHSIVASNRKLGKTMPLHSTHVPSVSVTGRSASPCKRLVWHRTTSVSQLLVHALRSVWISRKFSHVMIEDQIRSFFAHRGAHIVLEHRIEFQEMIS